MNDDLRYLHKWLNEEQTAPLDRLALARVLALVTEMGEALEFAADSTIGQEGDDEYDCDCAICHALDKYKEMTK